MISNIKLLLLPSLSRYNKYVFKPDTLISYQHYSHYKEFISQPLKYSSVFWCNTCFLSGCQFSNVSSRLLKHPCSQIRLSICGTSFRCFKENLKDANPIGPCARFV